MEEVDLAIIGGGIIGLACAGATARPGRTVCLLERHPRPGTETSTHNSGVIHAGIYYPTDSLKAQLCVEGRETLYRFCQAHKVPHLRCGKLILAGPDEDETRLERLIVRGQSNGVEDLEIVDADRVRHLEPYVTSRTALWSPSTGIVEAEALVRALHREAAARETLLLPGMPLISADPSTRGVEIRTPAEAIHAQAVVNAAGLYADEVSAAVGGRRFTIYPCRGEYAELVGRNRGLVGRPVYPLPAPAGEHLGIHVTPTTWGSVSAGPTVHYQNDKRDYERDRLSVETFIEPVRTLLPTVRPEDLRLGGTGIRAKLSPNETTFSDFLIERDPAQPRLVQAAGIDSPGLTACLSIARRVSALVDEILD